MRVIVIGGGIMGLCTAWALARREHDVVVCEQAAIPNELGSSFDQHRAIRHAYGRAEGYARLVDPALAAWHRLEADAGLKVYHRTGVLALDRHGGAWARDSAEVLERMEIAHRLLDPAEVAKRYPLLVTEGVEAGLVSDGGGVLAAHQILGSLRGVLAAWGVDLREGIRVDDIAPDEARVNWQGESERADAVVVAAGPWVSRLVPSLARRVTPSRQVVVYITPPQKLVAAWSDMPTVVDVTDRGGVYVIPPVAGFDMKIGDHTFSLQGDPDRDRDPSPEDLDGVFSAGASRIRDYERYAMKGGRTCFYTTSSDERFIVEPLGTKTWVMTGFSGHGFKFGAVMGECLADALEGRRSAEAVHALAAGAASA